MTKAKKSLLITLFAAMMIFAIGATSAFAATTEKVEWKGKCDSLVYTNSDGVETPYTEIVKTQGSDGLWKAVVNQEKYSSLPSIVKNASGYYWDFDGAKLGYLKDFETPTVIPTSWTRDDWDTQWDYGVLSGDYAFAAVAVKTEKGYATVTDIDTPGVWYGVLKGGDDYDPANPEAQTLTLSYKTEWITGGETDGTYENPFFFGTPDPTEVTIAKKASSVNDIALYWDEEKAGNAFPGTEPKRYDGAEHTVVASAVEGFTVSYQIYEDGAWKDGSVTVKDVGADAAVTFKVVVKNAKGETVTPDALKGTFTARIYANASNRLAFGFEATSSEDAYYKVEGTEYDAYSWIKAYSNVSAEIGPATKAAIEANNAELVAALKDVTDINATVNKDNPNKVALSVVSKSSKDLTPEDVATLNKKYATLLTNFGLTSVTQLQSRMATSAAVEPATPDFYATATVELNSTEPITKIDHIYFTEAPAKVTYKAKALKKKAKSFTVAAVADSGNAITYKMSSTSKKIKIDSATGKITVAKKTKKGTYKVKVYAQTEAGNGYAAAYTYQPMQITIKVKK